MKRTQIENLILKTALTQMGTVLKYSSCPCVWDELHGLRALALHARDSGLVSGELFGEIGEMQDAIKRIETNRRIEETSKLFFQEA